MGLERSELFSTAAYIIARATAWPNGQAQLQFSAQAVNPTFSTKWQARLGAAPDGRQLGNFRSLMHASRPVPLSALRFLP
jgi:hypothetical protein